MPSLMRFKEKFSYTKESIKRRLSSKMRMRGADQSSALDGSSSSPSAEQSGQLPQMSPSPVVESFIRKEDKELNQLLYEIQSLHSKAQIQSLDARSEAEKAAVKVDLKKSVNVDGVEITRLGAANIPLFKATPLVEGEQKSVVIRILDDQRLVDAKKVIAATVASQHLAQQFVCRPAEYSGGVVRNYLEVSEFCQQGDLNGYMERPENNGGSRLAVAATFSQNLIEMMLDFKKSGASYTDIKPANFLVNDQGRLVVSDIKSLILTGEVREVQTKGNIINTEGYRAPEQFLLRQEEIRLRRSGSREDQAKARQQLDSETTNLDALERYQIGVTIYEIVTGHHVASESRNEKGEHAFDFTHKVFSQAGGQILREVIEGLTKTEPEQRMSFEAAQEKLSQLSLHADLGAGAHAEEGLAAGSDQSKSVPLSAAESDEVVDLDEMMARELKDEEVIDLDKEAEEEHRTRFKP